jgi:hypothetical protein
MTPTRLPAENGRSEGRGHCEYAVPVAIVPTVAALWRHRNELPALLRDGAR